MEKILSDIQLAEVEIRYYEILIADAKQCGSQALVDTWQKGLEAEQKHLESLYQAEQEMQALDEQTNAEYCYVDEPGHTGGWTCRHPEHAYPDPDGLDEQGRQAWDEYERESAIEPVCECGAKLVYGHECSMGFWNGRQFLQENRIGSSIYEREVF